MTTQTGRSLRFAVVGALAGIALGLLLGHYLYIWRPRPSNSMCAHAKGFVQQPIPRECEYVRPVVRQMIEEEYLRRRGQQPVFIVDDSESLRTNAIGRDIWAAIWKVNFVRVGDRQCSFHIQANFGPRANFVVDEELQWRAFAKLVPEATERARCDQDGCPDWKGDRRWVKGCR